MHDELPRRAPRILAVNDDPRVMRMLERSFAERHYTLLAATTGQESIARVQQQPVDVVIVNQVLPDMTGLDVLRHIRSCDSHLPILFLTTQSSSITVIEAMKSGAFDFLPKPLDLQQLAQQVARALEVRRLTRVPVERAPEDAPAGPADLLLGNSRPMQDVWKAIGRAAAHGGPVLIEGEPGTGKELVSRVLHLYGTRAAGPLAIVSCTDPGDVRLEGELFGHASVPGVSASRPGKLEQTAGGTLVIDNIAALPPILQTKLVRLICEQQYERLGATECLRADVHILAMSAPPLDALVRQGAFRSDLYYLLTTFTIRLPPLRERRDDIPLLVDHFIKRFSRIGRTFDAAVARAADEALELLTAYDWPGNIDELQSVIRRALADTGGAVVAGDFLLRALGHGEPQSKAVHPSHKANGDLKSWQTYVAQWVQRGTQSLYAEALSAMEHQVLQAALDHTGGNQAQAAKLLGITRGHLRKKIRLLGLTLTNAVTHSESARELETAPLPQ